MFRLCDDSQKSLRRVVYLKDCQHGQSDVIEGGDSIVGPLPLLKADGNIPVAGVAPDRGSLLSTAVARVASLALLDHRI